MSLADEIKSDLQEIETDLPGNSFSYTYPGAGGTTVTGPFIPTMAHAGEQLIVGGKVVTIKRTAFIRADLFENGPPTAKQPLKLNDVEYRIAEVRSAAPGSHYELPVVDLSEL